MMCDAVIIIINYFWNFRFFCKKSEKANLSNICTVLCVRSFKLAIQDDASSKKLSKQKQFHMIFKSSYFSVT